MRIFLYIIFCFLTACNIATSGKHPEENTQENQNTWYAEKKSPEPKKEESQNEKKEASQEQGHVSKKEQKVFDKDNLPDDYEKEYGFAYEEDEALEEIDRIREEIGFEIDIAKKLKSRLQVIKAKTDKLRNAYKNRKKAPEEFKEIVEDIEKDFSTKPLQFGVDYQRVTAELGKRKSKAIRPHKKRSELKKPADEKTLRLIVKLREELDEQREIRKLLERKLGQTIEDTRELIKMLKKKMG